MISLQEIVDFAKVNKIDYGTDIIIVTEAYKALLKAKGLEDRALYFNKEEKEWYGPLVTEYFEWTDQ